MKVLKFLIEKEFKQMFRNPLIANLIVFFPTMVLLVFPWTITFEVNNIRVDVVDHGKGSYARRLTDKVEASPYFILNDTPPDYETAMQAMERGEIDMIVEIPHTFDRDIVKQQSSRVGLAVNSVNGSVGLLGSNYMTQIVNDLSKELASELLQGTSSLPRLTIEQRYRFNPQMDYKLFMIPGFFVIILTILCGILPALNIVLEKENGTIHQINVTPVQKAWFILAKLIPYWTIGLIAFIIAISVAYLIYGLWPAGSIFTVLFSGIVFIISVSGMGIIISNYSETLQQAAFLVIFFILIIILLSGMFTPISSMPVWAQAIASINPFTYLTSTLRMVYLNGSSLVDVSTNLLMLALFSLLLNGWAVLSYKKRG